jgi:hypothetical protein
MSRRRLDDRCKWDFFWAKDAADRAMLMLEVSEDAGSVGELPQLREITLSLEQVPGKRAKLLLVRLNDDHFRELFRVFCEDIVQATADAESASDALLAAIRRTWRWHQLLRKGTSRLLTPEEQKGLIGELLVLDNLLTLLNPHDAVVSWKGPFGAPKDFEYGSVLIESKTRRNAATPFVQISSEFQLDIPDGAKLFLSVTNLLESTAANPESFDLNQLVVRVTDGGVRPSPASLELMESALSAAGYRGEDDYSSWKWTLGSSNWYEVKPGFPSLASASVPEGISHVRYDLALNSCADFAIDIDLVVKTITGDR